MTGAHGLGPMPESQYYFFGPCCFMMGPGTGGRELCQRDLEMEEVGLNGWPPDPK